MFDLYEAAQIDERVTAGAAWLDTLSDCWHEAVDITGLTMSNGDHCVLGQAFIKQFSQGHTVGWGNGYGDAVENLLGGSFDQAAAYGFNTMSTLSPWKQTPEYRLMFDLFVDSEDVSVHAEELELLAMRWVQEIQDRRRS